MLCVNRPLNDQGRPVRSLGMGYYCRTQASLLQARLNQWQVKACRSFDHSAAKLKQILTCLCCQCHSVTNIDKMTYSNDLLMQVQAHIFRPKGMRDAVPSAHITESRNVTKFSPYAQIPKPRCHIAMTCHEAASCACQPANAITTPGCNTLPV
jgi:hypothetical protein